MNSKANYHIHTTHSDGKDSVAQIVDKLRSAGVESFSITDHNKVEGNIEAAVLAKKYGLSHANGVELSCCFDGEAGLDFTSVCHIVGLDFELKKMQSALDEIWAQKHLAQQRLFEALKQAGYALREEACFVDGKINERKTLAVELVELGYAPSVNAAFNKILNFGEFRQYACNLPFIFEGIRIIHECGGLAIAAHPFGTARGGRNELKTGQVEDYTARLRDYGADGIEVYYQLYSKKQIEFLEGLANKHGFLKSIATDIHGCLGREAACFDVEGVEQNETITEALTKRGAFLEVL